MGLTYFFTACAAALTLVVSAYHKVSQRIHNEPRQDGIVLSGVSAEFPIYSYDDVAARHRRWQESLPVTPAFSLQDRAIIDEKMLLGGNAEHPVGQMQVRRQSLSEIFGWALFDTKDEEGVPREEYRRPLALFDYVAGTKQPACLVPYRDKKWTALTYCFESQAEVDRFVNLKRNSVRFNNGLAVSGAQAIEASPFQEEKMAIVQNNGSPHRTIIDPDTAQLVKKRQTNDEFEIYMRNNPLGQIPRYFSAREAEAIDSKAERKAHVEAKRKQKEMQRDIWAAHETAVANSEASFNPKVVKHRHPPKWRVEGGDGRYVPIHSSERDRKPKVSAAEKSPIRDQGDVEIVSAPVELVEKLVNEVLKVAEEGPKSDRFDVDPYFLVARRKQ